MNLSHEQFLQLVTYDPATGGFQRVGGGSRNSQPGASLGGVTARGYIRFSVEKRSLYAHCAAVFFVTGQWPKGEVIHKDGNRKNNRWDNLLVLSRPLSRASVKPHSNNRAGHRGVFAVGRKWVAVIRFEGVNRRLGTYPSASEAAAAYAKAQSALYPFVAGALA